MDVVTLLSVFTMVVTGLFGALYLYFINVYSYWKKKGVPYLEPSFIVGNMKDMFAKKNMGEVYSDLYKKCSALKFAGIYQFHKPVLLVTDPEVIKCILVKDFDHFHDRGPPPDETVDHITISLFSLTGKRWKDLRAKMTPVFTSAKIKMMFETMTECGEELAKFFEIPANQEKVLEIKDVMARFTTDVIASCAFGIQCNCLKNPDAEFRKYGRKLFEPSATQKIRNILYILLPKLATILRFPFFPADATNFFYNVVKETVEYREKINMKRNDFMQLLIQLKNQGSIDDNATTEQNQSNTTLTIKEVASQAFMFFIAGYESSSSAMSFFLYEMAVNPQVQTKVQGEIDNILEKYNSKITYEAVMEMNFLEKAIHETLRKYPSVPFLNRDCTKEYKIPGTNITLDKGTPIIIPTLSVQYDPQYYPHPEQFDPTNFDEEAKAKRPFCTHLPFGEGPRICIGRRFGMMQVKTGLVHLLSKYEFHPCEKTSIPLKFDPKSFLLQPEGGFWLQIKNRMN